LYRHSKGSTVAGIEQRIIPAENIRERKLELLIAVLRAVPESRTLVFCSVGESFLQSDSSFNTTTFQRCV
jgi:superfamily II DNA/RNA helicase